MKTRYFTSKMKMADLIAVNHNLILVMPRLGITLGFGEQSVAEVCCNHGLDVDFVLMVCNVYSFDDYLPSSDILHSPALSHLVPYLMVSHQYYIKERLPHIERHLVKVASHAGDRYGMILNKFFSDYEQEVVDHFTCEEQEVFPYLQSLLDGEKVERPLSEHFVDNHTDMVDRLTDLTQIVYKYLPGDALTEELNELVFFILQLSSDLQKHALLEEKILLPYMLQLERGLE